MSFEDFTEYQKVAKTTAKPSAMDLTYLLGGLAVEGGEALDKYIKAIRDDEGYISNELKNEILKEVGDVLWFAALIYEYFEVDFEFAPAQNLEKLLDRKARGVIGGSGDNR
ncbi:nucleotide pyrophosphohydrolase [Rhodococcus phage Weasels2]|uniref:Nucleotide pyrophosphohydrolase n=1 Tax=Rhodococcus phage Weasels2 TaxID=1897437 RepID=A0A1I9SA87_9CAUD|nr:MazG-like pyrophosphatase [Rhodococcus phage Weasels2]AOZ63693.1 nucleotide pyrophosphohydrolase [Rhodococcus phage Weasels2]